MRKPGGVIRTGLGACLLGGWGLLGAWGAACSSGDPASAPPTDSAAHVGPTQSESAQSEPSEAAYRALETEAKRNEGNERGVAKHAEAAAVAQAFYRSTGERAWWDRASAHWAEAARRRNLPGACEASLGLARHEASQPDRLQEAFVAAYRTARRFEDVRGTGRCVDDAARMGRLLAAFRPSDERLRLVDSDPNEGDPSEGLHDAAPASFAEWIESENQLGASAIVTDVSVYNGEDEAAGDSARVVFTLSGPTKYTEKASPLGPVLSIEARAPSEGPGAIAAEVPVGGAGVDRVRISRGETTQVSFEGNADVVHQTFVLTQPFRIVVDLRRSRENKDVGAGLRVVVLDPGHGGDDHGARYGGLRESRVALDITRRVGGILERRLPDTRVIQTRTKDEFVSLEGRVAFANAVGADAFISIHLNAGEGVEEGGVATFVLDTTDDKQAIRLAARENGTTSRDVTDLQRILAGIYRKDQVGAATELATLVQTGTLTAARMHLPKLPDRGVKSAVFYVLVGAMMPAILVEASFINEPLENEKLATEKYRQSLAEGIAEGIVRYARAAAAP